MSQRPLAVCPKGHILARVGVLNGEPVIEYSAAVGGMSLRPEKGAKPRGRFNIAAHWSTFPIPPKEPTEVSVADGYCGACNKDFDLPMIELGQVIRTNASPMVIQPVRQVVAWPAN